MAKHYDEDNDQEERDVEGHLVDEGRHRMAARRSIGLVSQLNDLCLFWKITFTFTMFFALITVLSIFSQAID